MAKKGVERGTGAKRKPSPLDDIDHKLLAHLDKKPNAPLKELGELVGMSVNGVAKRYRKPNFLAALEEINKTTWDLILRAKKVAARNLLKMAASNDPKIAIDACKILFGPTLQDTNINVNTVKEVIYRTRFGEAGQLVQDKEEILDDPKDTIELLEISGITGER